MLREGVGRGPADPGGTLLGVTDGLLVVLLSLASALAFATSSTVKHVSAHQVPDAQDLRVRSVGRLVAATVRNRYYLLGIAADAVGLTLQLLALHLGALGVVQPLLITGLLFALLLRQATRRRVSPREIAWALVLTVSLAGFLVLAGTAQSSGASETADRVPAVVAAVAGLLLAGTCVVLGRRQSRAGRSAALLGVAVGATYAGTAALLKTLTSIALEGPLALLTSWQLYTVLVVGAGGLVLNQLAFQAGPLAASLPAIASVDPLASIALGVVVYDERIRHDLASGLGLGALLLLLGVAVIQLARLGNPADEPSRTAAGAG